MAATDQAPPPSFALADGFADLTKGSDISLDDARHPTKREPGEPTKIEPQEQVDDPPAQTTDDPETPPTDTTEPEGEKPTDKQAISDDLHAEMAGEEDKAKAETDRVAAEEAAAKEKEKAGKPAEAKPAESGERDGDLKYEAPPTVSQKTRKVITDFQQKAKAARDERDRERAERQAEVTELRNKVKAAEEKASTTALPKEAEDELKTLRERVRELDITKDPQIVAKFDNRIKAHNDSIISVLKKHGYDQRHTEDGKSLPAPERIEALLKQGISLNTLHPILKKMDELSEANNDPQMAADAEEIREYLRESRRVDLEKKQEIDQWKTSYDSRIKQRETQTVEAQRQRNEAFKNETERVLKDDVAALAKDLPFLNPPAGPAPGDSPAVAKSKQQAVDDYAAANKAVQEAVAEFQTEGVTPDKLAPVVGKLNASAIVGAVARRVIIPRLLREAKAASDRIKQLETEIGKGKAASSISKQHAAIAATPNGQEPQIPKDASTADALTSMARQMGINVNS